MIWGPDRIKFLAVNPFWLTIFSVISVFYTLNIDKVIPREFLLTSSIIVYLLFGAVFYFLFSGPFWMKLGFAIALPIIEVIYLGRGPDKPGLAMVVMYAELLLITLGISGAFIARKIVHRLHTVRPGSR